MTPADPLAPLELLLSGLGGDDLLVFSRLGGDRWAHLGGLGRGRGWAGIVELTEDAAAGGDPDRLPDLAVGAVCRVSRPAARQIVGPYQAREAVLVRLSANQLVVAGRRPGQPEPSPAFDRSTDADWLALAGHAVALVTEATPAKRLADELEVLEAVQQLALIDTGGAVDATLAAVADVVGRALSCEAVMVVLPGHQTAVRAADGCTVDEGVAAAVLADPQVRCVQEADLAPEACLGEQVRSWLLLPMGRHGGILAMHTDAAPRGFTTLCRQLGQRLAEAASLVVATAVSRARAEADLRRAREMAERDPLTGLGNRAAWERLVDEAQGEVAAGVPFGVLVIDVDGLKDINDRFGHEAGDELLCRFAELLRETCPGDDVVRLGGDEFGVLVRGPQPEAAARTRRDVLAAALDAGRGPRAPQASIGWCATLPGEDLRSCIRRADQQMYAQKSSLRPTRRRTDEQGRGLDRSLRALLSTAAVQPDAAEHGRLQVALQPMVSLPGGELLGVEALARWTHPVFGDVPPPVFVAQAEQSGLIGRLDRLMLRLAALEVVRLRAEHPQLWLSANLSARGLRPGDELVTSVSEILGETGLPPGALQLELTEMALGCPVHDAADALARVRGLGVGVALDDLGAGQSSLLRVAALPLTQIKIDRSILLGAGRSLQARRVLDGLVTMFQGLGLTVCLEGIETPAEIAIAVGSGADIGQGYAYGRPATVVPAVVTAVGVPARV